MELSPDDIDWCRFQRRKFKNKNDASVQKMAQSIFANGLEQFPLARPIGNRYELVYGERRTRACISLGWRTVPCKVREMGDDEARRLHIIENADREDLTVMQQAYQFADLLETGMSPKDAAREMGLVDAGGAAFLARRASLVNLSNKWQACVNDEQQAVHTWPAVSLEYIARLPHNIQDSKEIGGRYCGVTKKNGWMFSQVVTVLPEDLRSNLANTLHVLDFAPWDLKENIPKCGACDGCSRRSDCNPELFTDEDNPDTKRKGAKGAKCLDAECWTEKMKRHIRSVADALKAEGHPVTFAVDWNDGDEYEPEGAKLGRVNIDHMKTVKKGTPGATAVVRCSGFDAGTVIWVAENAASVTTATGVKPKTLAEKRAGLLTRRLVYVARSFENELSQMVDEKEPLPASMKPVNMAALIVAFGAAENEHANGFDAKTFVIYKKYSGKPLTTAEGGGALDAAFIGALEKMRVRLSEKIRWKTVNEPGLQFISEILFLDYKDYFEVACDAIKEPASWTKNAPAKPKRKAKAKK